MPANYYLGSSQSGAYFSPCLKYRYLLWRRWNGLLTSGNERLLSVVALNPSTANEVKNDPTIKRIISFAKSWNYDGLAMMNLFAYRATDPKEMKLQSDPVGPENDEVILRITERFPTVLCCWGVHGKHRGRAEAVREMLAGRHLCHLGLTADGDPRHPLYLPGDSKIVAWTGSL